MLSLQQPRHIPTLPIGSRSAMSALSYAHLPHQTRLAVRNGREGPKTGSHSAGTVDHAPNVNRVPTVERITFPGISALAIS